MRVRITTFFTVLALSLALITPLGDTWAAEDKGTLKVLKVTSSEKDFPIRKVLVWTPPLSEFDVNQLPIIYFLHGWPGTPEGIEGAMVPPILKLIQNGAKPFIAVFPDGNAKSHIDSEWADSADKKSMIETWLTTSVIDAVEGKNRRERAARAISGFSMGGYGAAIIGLHHPDLYSQVLPIAGYFKVDDLTGAFSTTASIKYQNPINFISTAGKARWALTEGKLDQTVLIRGQAALWSKQLTSAKAENQLFYYNGGHSYRDAVTIMSKLLGWLEWPESAYVTPIKIPDSVTAG